MAKYRIKLTQEEVAEPRSILKKGSHGSRTYKAAYVLLNCDEGEHSPGKRTNGQIFSALKICTRAIDRIKKKCMEGGIERALERAENKRVYPKKADVDLEAKIVQLCCSEFPEGFAGWTLRLLADKVVELGYVDKISHVSIYNTFKKTNLSLGE